MKLLFAALAVLLFAASDAAAESFCPCATDSGTSVGNYKNAECQALGVPRFAGELVRCLDFEGPSWTTTTGDGSLTDQSPVSGCGFTGLSLRGRAGPGAIFGAPIDPTCQWSNGATFTLGPDCDTQANEGGQPCGKCYPSWWLTGDSLQAGSNRCLGTFRTGDAAGAFSGSTTPSAPLAGSNSLAHIVPAGQTTGLFSGGSLTFHPHTFGISLLKAYAPNVFTSGVANAPWKGDQCGQNHHCIDTWQQQGVPASFFPFSGTNVYGMASCAARRDAATYVVGVKGDTDCNGASGPFRILTPSNYSQPTDWPLGTMGLVQVLYEGHGTSSTTITILFTPLGAARKTLFKVTGLDTTGAESPSPFSFNAYANANEAGGFSDTTEDSGRVTDNFFIQSWTSGTAPADPLAAMPTPSQMQFAAAAGPIGPPTYAPVRAQ